MALAVATYEPRDPSRTVLYKVVADHLETFLASLDADPDAKGLPAYVQMGGVRAYALTLLDVLITSIDCPDVYDHPHHDLAVLRQSRGQARRRTAAGPTGVGDVYPALR